jgi:uncharacterized protein with PQ loop repeat
MDDVNYPLLAGYLAAICFTIQYFPQAILNFQRKSVSGFSTLGIVVKLIGASFLGVNAYLTGESIPTILYGVFNITQHSVFMYQFATYTRSQHYYLWMGIPVVAASMGLLAPQTIRK